MFGNKRSDTDRTLKLYYYYEQIVVNTLYYA